mmetsp:Transcript_44572/g.134999  ORF Transcript_44572/g.134999 Transcript_44572/m.134999 type:complete len:240 (-) Transcript_44572:1049-1768(-)
MNNAQAERLTRLPLTQSLAENAAVPPSPSRDCTLLRLVLLLGASFLERCLLPVLAQQVLLKLLTLVCRSVAALRNDTTQPEDAACGPGCKPFGACVGCQGGSPSAAHAKGWAWRLMRLLLSCLGQVVRLNHHRDNGCCVIRVASRLLAPGCLPWWLFQVILDLVHPDIGNGRGHQRRSGLLEVPHRWHVLHPGPFAPNASVAARVCSGLCFLRCTMLLDNQRNFLVPQVVEDAVAAKHY